jgi:hypothetical protein
MDMVLISLCTHFTITFLHKDRLSKVGTLWWLKQAQGVNQGQSKFTLQAQGEEHQVSRRALEGLQKDAIDPRTLKG